MHFLWTRWIYKSLHCGSNSHLVFFKSETLFSLCCFCLQLSLQSHMKTLNKSLFDRFHISCRSEKRISVFEWKTSKIFVHLLIDLLNHMCFIHKFMEYLYPNILLYKSMIHEPNKILFQHLALLVWIEFQMLIFKELKENTQTNYSFSNDAMSNEHILRCFLKFH